MLQFPVAVTTIPVPTDAVAKLKALGASSMLTTSFASTPTKEAKFTVAVVVLSYTLLFAATVTVNAFAVISAASVGCVTV